MSPSMTIIQNTDRFGIISWGHGLAYSMFNKRTNRSFFVQGDDASKFRAEFDGLLAMSQKEGSVYFNMSLNQIFAQLFDTYDHIAEADSDFAVLSDRVTVH